MADADNSPGAPEKPRATWLDSLFGRLTAAAAVLGGLIAVGQSATSWIDGPLAVGYRARKDAPELELAEIKDKSALAESYIKLIIGKETAPQDQVMLLGALSELEGHPLQSWAKARFDVIQKNIAGPPFGER